MTGIDSYSTTAATNATATGGSINWAEGQAPSTVNNTARQEMADIRSAFNSLIWFQYGTGDQGAGNVAVPAVYSSGTAFTITGADVTAVYESNRRVKAVGSLTGTIYGSISSSSYNGGNSTTTVNVAWDSGSLSNETLTIYLSQIAVTGKPYPQHITLGALSTNDTTATSLGFGTNSYTNASATTGTWYTAIANATFTSTVGQGLWLIVVISQNVAAYVGIATVPTTVAPVITLTQLAAGTYATAQIDGSGNLQVKQTAGTTQNITAIWARIGT